MKKYDAIWLTGQPASGKTTLANLLIKKLSEDYPSDSYFNIDGDDLRDLFQNKDYSKKGREANIRLGMSIAAYLVNKGCIPIVSLVSPYIDLREEFKSKYKVLEVYLHTTEIRGRENYFAENYEQPKENFLDMDTTHKSEKESLDEILNVYW
ncbi:MAG: adenylyl-sulfate kinase [Candidatus Marinimicrobia bacterium]|nr:adenylyl-sulfate kinase [Candidatus Neomarinimicrobiota bacterium]|tara:strand:- start:1765 stop:2220 length:456 start_codon:yes stop_codon:yes gene_type:complete